MVPVSALLNKWETELFKFFVRNGQVKQKYAAILRKLLRKSSITNKFVSFVAEENTEDIRSDVQDKNNHTLI